jgi:hypothetical protein
MNFATLHNQRKLILVAAVVGIISAFLPWIDIVIGTINGFHGKGIIVFLSFAAALIVGLMGNKATALDKAMWLVTLATGAIALFFTVLYINDFSGFGGFGPGMGIGVWIALIASLGILAASWFLKSPGDSIQSGFNSLKNKVSSNINTNTPSSKMDELERLIKLKEEGKITEEEYQQMKSKIL